MLVEADARQAYLLAREALLKQRIFGQLKGRWWLRAEGAYILGEVVLESGSVVLEREHGHVVELELLQGDKGIIRFNSAN